jgi:hypothetical protein
MRSSATIAAVSFLLACADNLAPVPDGKQLSIIDAGGSFGQDFLATPDTLAAGLVTIKYNSFGSSSCNRPAGEGIATGTGTVTITAYDEFVPPGTACTADFARYTRSVAVTLAAGEVELRLRGVLSSSSAVVTELRRRVVVR